LIAFAIFWHFTTGEWRQYVPTLDKLDTMLRFYVGGIFRGEPHPVKKTELSKLNPLQRITYLGLKLLVIPLQIVSGGFYFYYNELVADWGMEAGVGGIAVLHTLGAFALVVFLIVHVYLTTTGHTLSSNIKAMVTGWEELDVDGRDAAS
jgi:thiosulfate reductase cytochrome b subunit